MKKYRYTRSCAVLLVLMVMLVMTGCRSRHSVGQVTNTKDSTYNTKTVIIHDTVFVTDPSQVSITVYDTVEVQNVSKTDGNATIKITKKNGITKAECLCDSLKIKAQLRHTLEKEYRTKNTTETKTITITEKGKSYVPWWAKALAWIGVLSLLIWMNQLKNLITKLK